jgi:hypothetical protein
MWYATRPTGYFPVGTGNGSARDAGDAKPAAAMSQTVAAIGRESRGDIGEPSDGD